ncbi:RNA polymerase sigma-70 factor, ECF subfamily [Porphyromonadaceae bacterium NLAE-zl-C104]|nr:RNA polymerase sigma-70 factor, ECF subfamily [Porphyromonadaceae bacterium NLAE-zl-C104]
MKNEKIHIRELVRDSYKDFTILYEYWTPHLYQFVFSLVKSRSITKDIVQETFIKIWTKRKEINPDQSFKSYLFTISYHIVLKEFRRQINHPLMGDYLKYKNDLILSENITEQKLDLEEFLVQYEKAKTKLTPRQREIFEMNKEMQISVTEIADKLSLTEQSVRNQLSASLKFLRKELVKYAVLLFYVL